MTRLVYIGGYGHSGSTLLEYLLAASPKVVACGEVASVLRERGRKGKCTCGREVRLCPLWGPLLASTETLDGMTHERLARALVAQDGGAHAVLVELLQDRLALGRRPLPPRKRAWAGLPARASRARPARGLLVGGEEVGTARHAPADAAALRLRGTRLVGREPRLRAVRPPLSRSLSPCPLRGSCARACRNHAEIIRRDSAGVRVARRRRSAEATTATSSMATACGRRACRLPR